MPSGAVALFAAHLPQTVEQMRQVEGVGAFRFFDVDLGAYCGIVCPHMMSTEEKKLEGRLQKKKPSKFSTTKSTKNYLHVPLECRSTRNDVEFSG